MELKYPCIVIKGILFNSYIYQDNFKEAQELVSYIYLWGTTSLKFEQMKVIYRKPSLWMRIEMLFGKTYSGGRII